jgi:hypothetical protein
MGEGGREMEEDKAKLKHGNTMSKKINPLATAKIFTISLFSNIT